MSQAVFRAERPVEDINPSFLAQASAELISLAEREKYRARLESKGTAYRVLKDLSGQLEHVSALHGISRQSTDALRVFATHEAYKAVKAGSGAVSVNFYVSQGNPGNLPSLAEAECTAIDGSGKALVMQAMGNIRHEITGTKSSVNADLGKLFREGETKLYAVSGVVVDDGDAEELTRGQMNHIIVSQAFSMGDLDDGAAADFQALAERGKMPETSMILIGMVAEHAALQLDGQIHGTSPQTDVQVATLEAAIISMLHEGVDLPPEISQNLQTRFDVTAIPAQTLQAIEGGVEARMADTPVIVTESLADGMVKEAGSISIVDALVTDAGQPVAAHADQIAQTINDNSSSPDAVSSHEGVAEVSIKEGMVKEGSIPIVDALVTDAGQPVAAYADQIAQTMNYNSISPDAVSPYEGVAELSAAEFAVHLDAVLEVLAVDGRDAPDRIEARHITQVVEVALVQLQAPLETPAMQNLVSSVTAALGAALSAGHIPNRALPAVERVLESAPSRVISPRQVQNTDRVVDARDRFRKAVSIDQETHAAPSTPRHIPQALEGSSGAAQVIGLQPDKGRTQPQQDAPEIIVNSKPVMPSEGAGSDGDDVTIDDPKVPPASPPKPAPSPDTAPRDHVKPVETPPHIPEEDRGDHPTGNPQQDLKEGEGPPADNEEKFTGPPVNAPPKKCCDAADKCGTDKCPLGQAFGDATGSGKGAARPSHSKEEDEALIARFAAQRAAAQRAAEENSGPEF